MASANEILARKTAIVAFKSVGSWLPMDWHVVAASTQDAGQSFENVNFRSQCYSNYNTFRRFTDFSNVEEDSDDDVSWGKNAVS